MCPVQCFIYVSGRSRFRSAPFARKTAKGCGTQFLASVLPGELKQVVFSPRGAERLIRSEHVQLATRPQNSGYQRDLVAKALIRYSRETIVSSPHEESGS